MSRHALIVFGKNPIPGRVKTRLAAEIGVTAAAELYRAFLLDTLERCARLKRAIRLYLDPTEIPVEPSIAPFDHLSLRQRGRSLGQRMKSAFEETFEAGYESVVIIGSDHPTLPLDRIDRAFSALSEPGTVTIGPSDDGGYYLLGLSEPTPVLFDDMMYSHSAVFDQTVRRACHAGLQVVSQDPWYDVDNSEDLNRLIRDVNNDRKACPHTLRSLIKVGLIENTR